MSETPQAPGYLVQELLGEGGFGVVYAGLQLASNQRVALKFFKRGFSHELEGLVRLGEHPFIAPVLDANASHDPPYLVTHLLAESLGARLKACAGPLPVEPCARWLEQIVRALHFIHQRGVAHCDLKPDNILLDDREQARLIDFGQSTARGQKANLGTAYYMPPEQVVAVLLKHSRPTPGWDVYALGATFYRALTGIIPRECDLDGLGDRVDAAWLTGYRALLLGQSLQPIRTVNPAVDTRLAMIVERCLDLDPASRYETAADILDDLEFRSSRRPHPLDELHYRWVQWRHRLGWTPRPTLDLRRHPALRELLERLLGDDLGLAFVLEKTMVLPPGREARGLKLAELVDGLRQLPDLRVSDDRQTLTGSFRYLGVSVRLACLQGAVGIVECAGMGRSGSAREAPELAALLRKLDARRGVLLLGVGMRPLLASRGGLEPLGAAPLGAEQLATLHRHLGPRQLEGFLALQLPDLQGGMRAAAYLPRERG